jgi:hypothetical protein
MVVQNANSTAAGGFVNAIRGTMDSNQNFIAAIRGEMNSSSGANYGVTAVTGSVSNNAAGLRAHDGGGPLPGTYTTAGVRGESNGTFNYGVLGLSRAVGVGGFRVDLAGDVVSGGNLGFPDTVGVAALGETSATGTKSFLEPHPSDASKMIRYISLEGNEAGTYFRGRGKFQNGIAVIEVPEDFRIVTDPEGSTVQITPIGGMATFGVVRIGLDAIVAGSRVLLSCPGIRHAYKHYGPIAENEKMFVPQRPDEPMPTYLPAVLQQPPTARSTWRRRAASDGTRSGSNARGPLRKRLIRNHASERHQKGPGSRRGFSLKWWRGNRPFVDSAMLRPTSDLGIFPQLIQLNDPPTVGDFPHKAPPIPEVTLIEEE